MLHNATYTTFIAPTAAIFHFYVLAHSPNILNTHEKHVAESLQCCKIIKFECIGVVVWQCLI